MISVQKATDDYLTDIVDLHQKLYPTDSFSGIVLSFILNGGNTYVATVDKKLVGYISVNTLLKSQISVELTNFLSSLHNVNINTIDSDSRNNPFLIIPLAGVLPKYKNILPSLIDKVIAHSVKKDYFKTKYLIVFVRRSDKELFKTYSSKGFIFSNFYESEMFANPNDDGLLMYKKINIVSNMLSK